MTCLGYRHSWPSRVGVLTERIIFGVLTELGILELLKRRCIRVVSTNKFRSSGQHLKIFVS